MFDKLTTNILSVFSETHYAIFIRNKLRKVINVRRFDVHLRGDLKLDAILKAHVNNKITIQIIIMFSILFINVTHESNMHLKSYVNIIHTICFLGKTKK